MSKTQRKRQAENIIESEFPLPSKINCQGLVDTNALMNAEKTLLSNEKFPVEYSDCLKTIELLNAFYCSDESNGKWINPIEGLQSQRLGRPDNGISDLYRIGQDR